MRLLIVLAAATLATAASAQLPPVPDARGVAEGMMQIGVPDPAPPLADIKRDTTRATHDASARNRNAVRVDAGASIRVDRGARCYYDDYYYDPYYRDGYYYCERRGTEAEVATRAKAR